jgi:benzoyl-CoA 2,3-epoxidase subunit A
MGTSDITVIKQHLIDPEICIRCNTCEATCPVGAITHDSRNYVVDAEKCNLCMHCVPPCPTGSIDNWRDMPKVRAYSVDEQLLWDELPASLAPEELVTEGNSAAQTLPLPVTVQSSDQAAQLVGDAIAQTIRPSVGSSTLPPWSAAHPFINIYGPKATQATHKTITATVTGNVRVTELSTAGISSDYDTHHIVLDFGNQPFPVLEGQSIGIIASGTDTNGKPHYARQYSIASPRNGERPGYNNVSLTVKRVLEDHDDKPVRGVASNYLCDLKVGDSVKVIGPFGASFLMANHPGSNLVMICTGTGSAPMRAMTEWRRRQRTTEKFESGKLMLFFGARTKEELPYFGPLQSLPKDFIDINLAFSRTPNQAKKYVQDAMRERASDLAVLMQDPNTYFYVCGLRAMEEGVLKALSAIATEAGLSWDNLGATLQSQGRLHLETY